MQGQYLAYAIRFLVFLALAYFIFTANKNYNLSKERGYKFLMVGVCLLVLGTIGDLVQRYATINQLLDETTLTYIRLAEGYIGYSGGAVLFLFGFLKLLPVFGELKQTEIQLRASEHKYRHLYENSPVIFFSLTLKGKVTNVNKHACETLHFERKQLIDKPLSNLICNKEQRRFEHLLNIFVNQQDSVHDYELPVMDGQGKERWLRLTAHGITDTSKKTIQVFAQDVTSSFKASEALKYRAHHDNITGLLNRVGIEDRLRQVKKSKSDDCCAAFVVDLRRFRLVNDTSGHDAGDELLRQVALLVLKHIDTGDVAARIGADEFFLLIKTKDKLKAETLVNKIIHDIDEYRFMWDQQIFDIGAHAGGIMLTDKKFASEEIIRKADIAATVARNQAHSLYWYHDEDVETLRVKDGMSRIRQLREALEEGHFDLVGQMIVPRDDINGPVSHLEVLVRMLDKDGKHIPPGMFLPAAEQYQLTHKIDQWVFDNVIDFLEMNSDFLARADYLSLNLSGNTLSHAGVLNHIHKALQKRPEIAKKMGFEITETAVISNLSRAKTFIDKVKTLGVRFALDDFGSGLSSFGYLKEFPVDYIKIDGQFIKDITNDKFDFAMVRSINEIAHLLGKHTIAEFVENHEIQQTLHDLGVDFYQGYHFGKPEPLSSFLD